MAITKRLFSQLVNKEIECGNVTIPLIIRINMTKKIDYISLFARFAIAFGCLSAVTDRLGLEHPYWEAKT